MLKVSKLSEEPKQSLIPPSGEVNADDIADKSLSKASVQLHAEVTVATADATKSLVASELAREQVNQPSTAEAEKVLDQNVEEEVKDAGFIAMKEIAKEQSLEFPTVEQLLVEADKLNKVVQETPENQTMHDSKETAKIQEDSDSDLQSMPDDDLRSVSGFKAADSDDTHKNEVSKSDHVFKDDNASVERLISVEIKSSLPALVTTALKEQLPRLLSAILKDCLPLIIKESLQTHILAASEKFAEKQTQLNRKVVKQLNRQFNISHLQDVKDLLESAVIIDETAEGEKKRKNDNAILALTQGEHQSIKRKELVVLNSEEKKSEGTISVEDDSDKDDK
ncbi:hypothetical protein Tco_0215746 [Tanacetum coccineum]